MPSYVHEALIELFRYRPALAAELLSDPLGLKLPTWRQARIDSGELPELAPTERRADAVVTLLDGDTPVLAVVLEVQLRRDPRKRRSWPAYLATLYARLGCPVVLLVLCPDPATARWCADPIEVGHPDWVLHPLVLGPDRVPVVTDRERAARSPELAVLSAIAHGARREGGRVLEALLSALDAVTDEHAMLYHEVVFAALPRAARDHLEALMATTTGRYREYTSPFIRKYVGQGRAEGEAIGEAKGRVEALLEILAARGIELPEPAHTRIRECTDIDQLDAWIRRAATADSIAQLFD